MSTCQNDHPEDVMTRERALAGRFRKKPVVIEAWQWDGHSTAPQRPEWLRDPSKVRGRQSEEELRIITLEGEMIATKGDWIIRGVKGEIYPCKPDIFSSTYEPAALASREQVLEEGLRKIAEHPHRDGESRNIAKAALASTQQEPAPAADAEGITTEIQIAWRGAPEEIKGQYPSQFKAYAAGFRAALRRYAGDGGGLEEALTRLLAIAGKLSSAGGENLSLSNARYELRQWGKQYNHLLDAAARAKSGEKGGAGHD